MLGGQLFFHKCVGEYRIIFSVLLLRINVSFLFIISAIRPENKSKTRAVHACGVLQENGSVVFMFLAYDEPMYAIYNSDCFFFNFPGLIHYFRTLSP